MAEADHVRCACAPHHVDNVIEVVTHTRLLRQIPNRTIEPTVLEKEAPFQKTLREVFPM